MTPTESKTAMLLRQIRARGLSQIEIRRRTGIPQSRLSRWENGVGVSATDDVLALHDLLHTLNAPGAAHAGEPAHG